MKNNSPWIILIATAGLAWWGYHAGIASPMQDSTSSLSAHLNHNTAAFEATILTPNNDNPNPNTMPPPDTQQANPDNASPLAVTVTVNPRQVLASD